MGLNEWFRGLAPRERILVAVGGGVALLALLYLLVVEPATRAFAERERRVDSLESQLAWMRETAAEVRALRDQGASAGGAGEGDDRPAYVTVDAALDGSGLPSPSRLEPAGDSGGARLDFEQVPFDRLVRLLGDLRADHGLRVTRARVERGEEGRVAAQFTLERPQ